MAVNDPADKLLQKQAFDEIHRAAEADIGPPPWSEEQVQEVAWGFLYRLAGLREEARASAKRAVEAAERARREASRDWTFNDDAYASGRALRALLDEWRGFLEMMREIWPFVRTNDCGPS